MTIEAASAGTVVTKPEGRTILGHPLGLAYLFGTELWERFSFYGMQALFVLYLVNNLFTPGHLEHVLFYGQVKAAYESVNGPLGAQGLASYIYGDYVAVAYFAPFFGGILADRVLGQRRAVLIGAALLATGYFLLSFEAFFFVGLPIVVFGNGLFKPNISSQVGNLYAQGDHRIDRAFSIFYVGVNIGSFFSSLILGGFTEPGRWNYGFLTISFGMLIGLIVYIYGSRALPPDALTKAKAARTVHEKLTPRDWKAIGAFVVLVTLSTAFWAVYWQQFDTINLWTDANTDRDIAVFGWQFTIPTTWFLAINAAYIVLLTPLINWLWIKQAKRNREPSTTMKLAIGCWLLGLSFLFMLAPVAEAGATGKASWLWLVAFYVVYTAGELYLSPIGLSLVTKIAPARMVSMLMGIWFLSFSAGGHLAGWLGSYWEVLPKTEFFLISAAIPIAAGSTIALLTPWFRSLIKE